MDALNFIVDLLHGDQVSPRCPLIGAEKGVIKGGKDFEACNTIKLRANRILNAGGLFGRVIGIGLLYAGALFKAAINVRFAALAGAIEGVRDFEARDTMKLMANMILNEGGLYRRMIENRAGVIRFLVAGIVSEMVAVRDVDDVFNSVAAGLGTKALFKAAN
ncbi:hypothetical protein Tco_0880492 [Tanacetum coccineum]